MTKHIREKLDQFANQPLQPCNRLMRIILEEMLDELDKLKLLSDLHEPVLSTPKSVKDCFTLDAQLREKVTKIKGNKK